MPVLSQGVSQSLFHLRLFTKRRPGLPNSAHNWEHARKRAPGPAGHAPQTQDRRGVARSAALGLIPYWCADPKGGRKPINAKCETVGDLPTFRDTYRLR